MPIECFGVVIHLVFVEDDPEPRACWNCQRAAAEAQDRLCQDVGGEQLEVSLIAISEIRDRRRHKKAGDSTHPKFTHRVPVDGQLCSRQA